MLIKKQKENAQRGELLQLATKNWGSDVLSVKFVKRFNLREMGGHISCEKDREKITQGSHFSNLILK